MNREFQVVDLIDSKNGRYIGQAIFCAERGECPLFTINNRANAGEIFEAFAEGARQAGGDVNLFHINMPIEIDSSTPYMEIRNTIVGEMKMRTTCNQQDIKQGE